MPPLWLLGWCNWDDREQQLASEVHVVVDADQTFPIEFEFIGPGPLARPYQGSTLGGFYEALIVPLVCQTFLFILH